MVGRRHRGVATVVGLPAFGPAGRHRLEPDLRYLAGRSADHQLFGLVRRERFGGGRVLPGAGRLRFLLLASRTPDLSGCARRTKAEVTCKSSLPCSAWPDRGVAWLHNQCRLGPKTE